MTESENKRLDRIEDKIDRLADVVVSLARAEEKLANLEIGNSRLIQKFMECDSRIDSVETQTRDNTHVVKSASRVFWIVVTCVISTLVGAITVFLQK